MKYVIGCKSLMTGNFSYCKDQNGDMLVFDKKCDADNYAEKMRNKTGINYHYWVSEYEPIDGCGIGGSFQGKPIPKRFKLW